jgi:hypothetical protein
VTSEDMKLAFRQVRPSAMREVALDIPKVIEERAVFLHFYAVF